MFSGCKKLGSNSSNGAIPWDMFYTRNDELLYNKLTDASGLFYNCGFKSGLILEAKADLVTFCKCSKVLFSIKLPLPS